MLKNLGPGTVLLIGALSLAAGWLGGSASSANKAQADAAARARSGPRPIGSPADAAPFTRQLRERMEAQPARVPETGRNPFVFETRRAPVARRAEAEAVAVPPPPEPVPYTPPAPVIKLSGIAASQEGGATVLTAIISDNGALAFVKTGDKLPSGATVIKVEETGVVLMDAAGITQTLKLP
jgi:hypothetical protein